MSGRFWKSIYLKPFSVAQRIDSSIGLCFGASNPNRFFLLFGEISAILLFGLPFLVRCEELDLETA